MCRSLLILYTGQMPIILGNVQNSFCMQCVIYITCTLKIHYYQLTAPQLPVCHLVKACCQLTSTWNIAHSVICSTIIDRTVHCSNIRVYCMTLTKRYNCTYSRKVHSVSICSYLTGTSTIVHKQKLAGILLSIIFSIQNICNG